MFTIAVAEYEQNIFCCLLDDNGRLLECHPFSETLKSEVGNIYVGVVKNKLKGVGGYFVDYGPEKNGFLPINEVKGHLSSGQHVIVQVKKDAYDAKGAKLTTRFQLTGDAFILLTDTQDMIFSSKLPQDQRTKSIRSMIKKEKPENIGCLVRTGAYHQANSDLISEWRRLLETYMAVEERSGYRSAYSLVYDASSSWQKKVQEMNLKNEAEIVIDKCLIESLDVSLHNNITVNNQSVFLQFDLREKIRKGILRKQWLPSGGSIIIDKTEAMTVIDVNSGKNDRKTNERKNTLRINLEAATAISRYIRLANASGIIIVDFIDMKHQDDYDQLINKMENEVINDPVKVTVHGITSLGLMEITRKRMEINLSDKLAAIGLCG